MTEKRMRRGGEARVARYGRNTLSENRLTHLLEVALAFDRIPVRRIHIMERIVHLAGEAGSSRVQGVKQCAGVELLLDKVYSIILLGGFRRP